MIIKTKPKIFNYREPFSKSIAEQIVLASKSIKSDKVENIFAYSKNGLFNQNSGLTRQVGFDKVTWKNFFELGKLSRIVIGHNHPSGGKLSEMDMYRALVENATDIFAVTPNEKCYIMTLPIMSKNQKKKLDFIATLQFVKAAFAVYPALLMKDEKRSRMGEFFRKGMEKIFEKHGAIFKELKLDELSDYLIKQNSK